MTQITEHDVIGAVSAQGGVARLLGGRAVANICGPSMPEPLRRDSADIDIVTRGRDRKALRMAMAGLGCEAEVEFNLINGKERMMFHFEKTKIDVFVDVFRMCHTLRFGERLQLCPMTLSPSDLLLTKLQVVHAEDKDLSDAAALLLCCELQGGPHGTVAIDTDYLAQLLGGDWGLWRTATGTLKKLEAQAATVCKDSALAGRLGKKIEDLMVRLEGGPRRLGWRLRNMIGERRVWYELPEEPRTES